MSENSYELNDEKFDNCQNFDNALKNWSSPQQIPLPRGLNYSNGNSGIIINMNNNSIPTFGNPQLNNDLTKNFIKINSQPNEDSTFENLEHFYSLNLSRKDDQEQNNIYCDKEKINEEGKKKTEIRIENDEKNIIQPKALIIGQTNNVINPSQTKTKKKKIKIEEIKKELKNRILRSNLQLLQSKIDDISIYFAKNNKKNNHIYKPSSNISKKVTKKDDEFIWEMSFEKILTYDDKKLNKIKKNIKNINRIKNYINAIDIFLNKRKENKNISNKEFLEYKKKINNIKELINNEKKNLEIINEINILLNKTFLGLISLFVNSEDFISYKKNTDFESIKQLIKEPDEEECIIKLFEP